MVLPVKDMRGNFDFGLDCDPEQPLETPQELLDLGKSSFFATLSFCGLSLCKPFSFLSCRSPQREVEEELRCRTSLTQINAMLRVEDLDWEAPLLLDYEHTLGGL